MYTAATQVIYKEIKKDKITNHMDLHYKIAYADAGERGGPIRWLCCHPFRKKVFLTVASNREQTSINRSRCSIFCRDDHKQRVRVHR
jgi:hypothetical protein